jgi:crotonobetainyl-CoA:carnitine CoA-transferase CaiB-like acyl-CoA transferase
MAVDVVHPAAGPGRVLGMPFKLSATAATVRRPAPRLGEHTAEILREAGYDEAAIRDLVTRKIV